jgi:hypothetical protein
METVMTRNPADGVWSVCKQGEEYNACGDGLNADVNRDVLAANPPELCKNKKGEDEAPVCKDDRSDYEQRRNPANGEFIECPKGFAPCGDGLNPKVLRSVLTDKPHDLCKDD